MQVRQVIVFCGDRFHPGSTVRTGLSFLEGKYRLVWVEDPRHWDPADLTAAAAVVLAKSNHCTPTDHAPWTGQGKEEHIARFVAQGGGLVAVHSGIAGYQDVTSLKHMLGGTFIGHPPLGEVTLRPEMKHEILGASPQIFTILDEHYQVKMDASDVLVFLRSQSAAGTQPAGWTRLHGRGRVCVLTPGHTKEVWHQPLYQTLIHNAISWAAAKI